MARGGYRPGAGRPKGIDKQNQERLAQKIANADPNMTPLDFILSIVRDPTEDMDTRLRAAAIAAPFCHAKAGEKGKKDERKDAAAKASMGKFMTPAAPMRLVS